jgi:hypothetical protein
LGLPRFFIGISACYTIIDAKESNYGRKNDSLEQSVHSLNEGQQQLLARMTEVFEMLSTHSKDTREVGESSLGKNREGEGENV